MTDAERITQLEDILATMVRRFEVTVSDEQSGDGPVVAQARAIIGPEAWAQIRRQAAAEAEVAVLRSLLDTELATLRSTVDALMAARTPASPFAIWSRKGDTGALDASGPSLGRWLAQLVLRRTEEST